RAPRPALHPGLRPAHAIARARPGGGAVCGARRTRCARAAGAPRGRAPVAAGPLPPEAGAACAAGDLIPIKRFQAFTAYVGAIDGQRSVARPPPSEIRFMTSLSRAGLAAHPSASRRRFLAGAAALAAGLAALIGPLSGAVSAHGYKVGSLEIGHPWSRATPANAPVAGGYMTIENTGDTDDRLVSVSAEISAR